MSEIETRGGMCLWMSLRCLLLSGKADDKRDIDVLLMGIEEEGRPRHARLVAAGEEVIAERRSSTAFRLDDAGAA